jgi:hypothetical protein
MASISVLKNPGISHGFTKAPIREIFQTTEISRSNPVLENIRSEAGEDFFQYLRWLKLAREPNILTLSSRHHFYYDSSDLKKVKTLINLKKLNNIKHLEAFISSVKRLLPRTAYFIGCFKNNDQDGVRVPYYRSVKLMNQLINIIDSRTDRSMSKKDVTRVLEENNLKIIDFTLINGITYFCSQNHNNE